MEFMKVISALGISDDENVLRKGWDETQAALPAGGVPFLTPRFVRDACRQIGFPDEVAEASVGVAERVRGSEALVALAWHCHRALFASDHYWFDDVKSWPSLSSALDTDANGFYLLVILSGVTKLREVNSAHSVPAEVERETLGDVVRSLSWRTRRDASRPWGMHAHDVAWFANFLRGDLYRLGRLQFQFGKFDQEARAFRHTSGAVLALSEDGIHYDSDGQQTDADGAGTWTAELAIGSDAVAGNPILPTGVALPKKVTLSLAEWRQALAPRDPILNIHMPGGKPLTHADCGESFRRAVEFFSHHFPERPFAGFSCYSWLLDGQLEEMLPPAANMVRFQRDVYLLPTDMDSAELFRSVLHQREVDTTTAPRGTALQRAIVARLEKGEKLKPRAGGCFLLPDDLNWGAEVYRSQHLEQFLR